MNLFGYYGMGFYGFDPTYYLVIIGMIITVIAQVNVNSTMKKYSKIGTQYGLTGEDVSNRILNNAGIRNVSVERVKGEYTDHYDPRSKVLRLSSAVHDSTSITAIGVAAHEVGHAIQDQQNYTFLRIRSALVPVASFGSSAGFFSVILGIILSFPGLITLGIIVFSGTVLFQVVTLPVEFNASSRALKNLRQMYLMDGNELKMAKKVLRAAALTYVAAAATTILTLLRLVLLSRGSNRD
ncbi:MAG: peptidase [Clostridiales bacterium]|jgi:Zn-dependent membrane protease YugP|nr:peptidase [Clostridiales bacterium]